MTTQHTPLTDGERARVDALRAEIAKVSGTEWRVDALSEEARKDGACVYSPHLGGVARIVMPKGSGLASASLFYLDLIARMRNDVPLLLDLIDRFSSSANRNRNLVDRIGNILGRIPGINDERDSVPILLALRELWPEICSALSAGTPAARWREEGKPDPTPQDYERAALPLGRYTDDELANAAYLTIGTIPENLSNAAKQRMRWLSRRLVEAEMKLAALAATRQTVWETIAAWADKTGVERPIDAEAMKLLKQNPTTKAYWERFTIPLYAIHPGFAQAALDAVRSILCKFSSPTVGRGDVHGGIGGIVVYDDQWPFIAAELAQATITAPPPQNAAWRTDFENMPDGKEICFYWKDGSHGAFGGAVSAMNFGFKDTEWMTQPSHWSVISEPGVEVSSPRLADDWRDIKTAPKDGDLIEVKYLSDEPRRVRWVEDGYRIGWGLDAFNGALIQFEPTHWRPITTLTAGGRALNSGNRSI